MKKLIWRIIPVSILIFSILFCVTLQHEAIYVRAQYFEQCKLTIQINNQNGGTTSPGPGVINIDFGLSIQVEAQPKSRYLFKGWYLNGIYQHELTTITVTMYRDNVLMAVFSQEPVALTITVNPAQGGTTNPPSGTTYYQYGTDVYVTVHPDPDYVFEGWYLDGEFMGKQTSITVPLLANRELGAYFAGDDTTPEEPEEPPVQLPPATLTVSCDAYTTYSDFNVEINGALTANGVGLPSAGVLIYVSVTGGASWDVLSFVNTDTDGTFSVSWKPSVTGTFLLNATWAGNSDYSSTITTVSFAVTPYEEQSVFSVTSNSTLSGLLFNSESNELSFTVTGPSGTTGYTSVIIPKSLISDISSLTVYVDGDETSFNSMSQTDAWKIEFTYSHSTHQVVVNLESKLPPESESEEPDQPFEPDSTGEEEIIPRELLFIILVIAAIVVVAVVGYKFGKSKGGAS